MENSQSILLVILGFLLCASLVTCLPKRSADDILQETSGMVLDKRPKYMDTRRDLDVFKDLVLMSVQELVDEGRLQPSVLPEEDRETSKPVEKRRYMGLCMHRQDNQYIPFPCLRAGR